MLQLMLVQPCELAVNILLHLLLLLLLLHLLLLLLLLHLLHLLLLLLLLLLMLLLLLLKILNAMLSVRPRYVECVLEKRRGCGCRFEIEFNEAAALELLVLISIPESPPLSPFTSILNLM